MQGTIQLQGQAGQWRYLFSPAQFFFSPETIDQPWPVRSPDLDLTVSPLYAHHTRMRMPPVLPYIDVDYYELLVGVKGCLQTPEGRVDVQGIGKFDHNFNLW